MRKPVIFFRHDDLINFFNFGAWWRDCNSRRGSTGSPEVAPVADMPLLPDCNIGMTSLSNILCFSSNPSLPAANIRI